MILIPEIREPVILVNEAQMTLSNASIDYDPDDHDYTMYRSVINGAAILVSRGEYFKGTIDVFDITFTNYSTIKSIVGQVIRLWPFGTGFWPLPPAPAVGYYPYVDVLITKVSPYHRNNAFYIDACIISFESEMPYTLSLATDTGLPPEPPEE
ncbi:MAG: hypothetical protein PHY48_15475 [Candidatus Cloacimonetes bacterium]|nr:hypothetical protein [Candidatus Cloacimonadota bacterium]